MSVIFCRGGDFQSQGGDADGRPTRGRAEFTAGCFSGRNGRAISWRIDRGDARLETAAGRGSLPAGGVGARRARRLQPRCRLGGGRADCPGDEASGVRGSLRTNAKGLPLSAFPRADSVAADSAVRRLVGVGDFVVLRAAARVGFGRRTKKCRGCTSNWRSLALARAARRRWKAG